MSQHGREVELRERFRFGENWRLFLNSLTNDRIALAEASLKNMLGVESLKGKTFLDVGSGSGLFSLAARRLGASVHSFDYDPQSVACTAELRRRYYPEEPEWTVESGSALDKEYLRSLGQFDIVYSWGVLHHTGSMWEALDNMADLVRSDGRLFIALYNDQGRPSERWWRVKRAYNRFPAGLRWLVLGPALIRLWGPTVLRDALKGSPLRTWRRYAEEGLRGMSAWRDVVDWVGGLPFEVAKPEEVFGFYRDRGFSLVKLRTCAGGLGCNEFVFEAGDRSLLGPCVLKRGTESSRIIYE